MCYTKDPIPFLALLLLLLLLLLMLLQNEQYFLDMMLSIGYMHRNGKKNIMPPDDRQSLPGLLCIFTVCYYSIRFQSVSVFVYF